MDIEHLRQRANAGSVVAQTVLGIAHLEGYEGLPVKFQEAFGLLSAAADKGAGRAMYHLARMYAEGLGVTKISGAR